MAINLDAAKAARREAIKEQPTITYGGRSWELPIELPLETAVVIADLQGAMDGEGSEAAMLFRQVVTSLLGDTEGAKFMEMQPSIQDVSALIIGLVDEYGLTVGESEASQTS
jgi:hypothetical protein